MFREIRDKRHRLFNVRLAALIFLLLSTCYESFSQEERFSKIYQDTAVVASDSTVDLIRNSTIKKDTTQISAWSTPWQISKSVSNQQLVEDLGDVLYYLPGMRLTDLGSAGQETYAGRHGANAMQTIFYWDGRPLYDPLSGGIDLNFLPVQFIKTIQAEQGASSFPSEGAEKISLVSETFEENIPHSEVSYHKAPFGFSDVDISFGQRISKKMSLLLGGIIKSYDGRTPAHSFEQQNFRGKLVYQFSPSWQYEYVWLQNKLNRGEPGRQLEDGSYATPNATQKNSRLDQTLIVHGKLFKNDTQNFKTRLYYSSLDSKFKDKDNVIDSKNSGSYAGLNFELKGKFFKQNLTAGGDFNHEWSAADEVGKQRRSFASFFLHDDLERSDKFGIRLSGSFQFHDDLGSHLGGGIGSFVRIAKELKLQTSLQQSVRYPTFFELYARTSYFGNRNLKSEVHRKLLMGLEWKPALHFSLKTDFYVKQIDHPIDLTPVYILKPTFYNRSKTEFAGLDFQFDWNVSAKFQFTNLFAAIDKDRLINQPRIMLISYLQYTDSFFQNNLKPSLRLEGRIIGERKGSPLNFYSNSLTDEKLNPVYVLNAYAILDFGNLKFFFTLENILDQTYELIESYPMNERTFHYGIKWEFWD